jgi:CheY-like chemotaxis protein/two-component sensor histidine kinase
VVRLVDDLLDVARLTQDKLVIERQHLDARSLLQGILDEVAPLFKERKVELVTQVDDVEIPVLGDRTRLHQLQVNLLSNAARYTPSGGRATYTLGRVDGVAEIRVVDSGEGIAPNMLERIFDLFVQAGQPGARGRDGGLGVGLALVRRIVELHGGEVSVASSGLGKGTEFRVRLPLAAELATEPKAELPSEALALERPRTVLLVDDDDASRTTMGKLLMMDDVAVVEVADGPAAIEHLARSVAPDLVLLDIGLPGMDGHEVCRRMRALPAGAELCIFALTGFGQEHDRIATTRAGFDAHLTKPVDVDEVYACFVRHSREQADRRE